MCKTFKACISFRVEAGLISEGTQNPSSLRVRRQPTFLSLQGLVVVLETRHDAKVRLTLGTVILRLPPQDPPVRVRRVPTVIATERGTVSGLGTVTERVVRSGSVDGGDGGSHRRRGGACGRGAWGEWQLRREREWVRRWVARTNGQRVATHGVMVGVG